MLGLTQAPVVRLEDLTEAQAKAYMLADNKLTDRSSWDEEKLAVQLKELSNLFLDFDIEDTGFELPEIDLLIQGLNPAEDEIDRLDEFSIAEGPPVTQAGDLWCLGEHRVLCGNALDVGCYATLLDDEKAAGVFTDPPYNVKIGGNVSSLGKITHREFAMASGEMNCDEFTQFLASALALIKDHSNAGAVLFACMDWRHLAEILAAGRINALDLLNLCVWVKTNGGMGAFYRSQHELILVFRNGQEPHRNNVQLGRFGRNRSNVWHYPGANVPTKSRSKVLRYHPTVKPVGLVAEAIRLRGSCIGLRQKRGDPELRRQRQAIVPASGQQDRKIGCLKSRQSGKAVLSL